MIEISKTAAGYKIDASRDELDGLRAAFGQRTIDDLIINGVKRDFCGTSLISRIMREHGGRLKTDSDSHTNEFMTRWRDERAKKSDIPLAPEYVRNVIDGIDGPYKFDTAIPVRDYQARAATIALQTKSLLLADDVGLGKSATATCLLTEPRCRPALIVCMPHLLTQWHAEIRRFVPGISICILKGKPQRLPNVGVFLISYAKLAQWASMFTGIKLVIWDEVQELRGAKSARGNAARNIAKTAEYRLGLSATPIHNFADEFWRVMEAIKPGMLGSPGAFTHRYLTKRDGCSIFRNPEQFGKDLRNAGVFLRRTRKDVARELPQINVVDYRIDADAQLYETASEGAAALAEIILANKDKQAVWQATERMPNILRMATGVAKSKFVAEFVKMLLETREKVVLFGWHRQVIEKWHHDLAEFNPRLYSGSEGEREKQVSKREFISGKSRVLILSLRSGVGLDGLQNCCDTVAFGELDWTPAVHEQAIGRVARDGQRNPVDAFFLTADIGADPSILRGLDLKTMCSDGLRNPGAVSVGLKQNPDRIKNLAQEYLLRRSAEVIK